MLKRFVFIIALALVFSAAARAQNTNSSSTARPRSATSTAAATPSPAPKPSTIAKPKNQTSTSTSTGKRTGTGPSGSEGVLATFNSLLDGIRKRDVNVVTGIYWNSPQLTLFNNNGTVTKGWEQVKKNRESSYPDLKDVTLDVRDVHAIMLGPDGALITCLWTQSQVFRGTPETASGRMTIVFRLFGKEWKAVHLHSSPDAPDPSRVLPSEQSSSSKPSPTVPPSEQAPSPAPSPTP